VLQYVHTIGNFLTGDFGYSMQAGVPVERPAGGQPAADDPARGLALRGAAAGVIIAVLSSLPALAWLRSFIQSLPSLFVSVPTFWLGIMLIQIFSFRLGWCR
jgi:peptide/nickel transport system permease protein